MKEISLVCCFNSTYIVYLMRTGGTPMRRTIAFVLLLAATVLWAGCATSNKSNNGNANMAPANTNAAKSTTNNANAHGNMNMDKKAKPKKTP